MNDPHFGMGGSYAIDGEGNKVLVHRTGHTPDPVEEQKPSKKPIGTWANKVEVLKPSAENLTGDGHE